LLGNLGGAKKFRPHHKREKTLLGGFGVRKRLNKKFLTFLGEKEDTKKKRGAGRGTPFLIRDRKKRTA